MFLSGSSPVAIFLIQPDELLPPRRDSTPRFMFLSGSSPVVIFLIQPDELLPPRRDSTPRYGTANVIRFYELTNNDLCRVKSGFVNIIGNPNVGKSTLMNALVGQRLSIITSKAQTTRHRIFGIVNGDDFQMVFSDTPGIIQPAYALQERMMTFVQSAFEDADILLYVTEPHQQLLKDERFQERLNQHQAPLLLVINKIDLIDQEQLEKLNQYWIEQFPKAEIIPLSALKEFNTGYLFDRLLQLLPEGPAWFDREALTDRTERFFTSEIIREQILQLYDKEVPYSCEVEVDSFKETPKRLEIRAIIHVARDSQKGILIGHQGKALQRLADRSRKELQHFFDQPIFLDLYIKVSKDWRGNDRQLRRFGYQP